VERVLGQGNMGLVLLATHLQLDQLVALKFLLPSALSQAELEARFAQEARAAAKIKSEHVVRVIDVSVLDDGAPYIVMEYLEGTDLAKLLVRRGPLPVAQAVTHVLQACEALAEAHAAGIVHRDLKPSNIFLAEEQGGPPHVKVLDFGIARVEWAETRLTNANAPLGTPGYMSPEQEQGQEIDHRSDLFAMGGVLYECLTGFAPPFHTSELWQRSDPASESESGVQRALRAIAPDFRRVIEKAMAPLPRDRYADARALREALLELKKHSIPPAAPQLA
jgi:serine/threonine protein kinase